MKQVFVFLSKEIVTCSLWIGHLQCILYNVHCTLEFLHCYCIQDIEHCVVCVVCVAYVAFLSALVYRCNTATCKSFYSSLYIVYKLVYIDK